LIAFHLLGLDCIEEKPEPDYYICKDPIDFSTGGRCLSREEKQIARRLELYDRLGKGGGVGTVVSGLSPEDERSMRSPRERTEDPPDGSGRTWFGVGLGRNKRVRK
jgi:hypothetical protein